MLHTYMILYIICFVATVLLILALLIAGTKLAKEEAHYQGAEETPTSPTTKEWVVYILRAFLIAYIVSFAAPLILIFYIFMLGSVFISLITKE